nr:hypothetical protein [Tanacetum cinerariifolium]
MNQDFYNSNSLVFDQTKTPQFPVVHPPPQETSIETSHDQENSELESSCRLRRDDDVDYTIAITPILSTEEPYNSLSMGDEHLDTIPAMELDEVIKSSVEDLVPIPSESEGIPDTMCDVHLVNNPTPLEAKYQFEIVINSNDDYSSSDDDSLFYENIEYVEASPHDSEFVSLEVEKIVVPEDEEIEDDNLREKLLKVNLLIAEIEALKDDPTPSSEFLTKSTSTSPTPFLEGTKTFHNSLPEFENFCFDLEEISSGITTTHSVISLPKYEAFSFYDDHIKEIRSGGTTTQSDISLHEYDSFIFDLSNDQFPPTDRGDLTHEEFGDELAHIISPPKYDCFYFRNFPDPSELISSLNSEIRENLSSTTCVNLPVEDDYSPLLAYVVWIFLAYLTYPIIPPHLHSFGNEDTIFDPGITINRSYSFKPGLSHRLRVASITPVLSTEEPVDSLSMGDEHLDTIPATESDEVIKSSVEDLVPIPSESEGIPEHMCDVPFHDNSPPLDVSKDQFEDFSESHNETKSSSTSLNSLLEETSTFHNSLPEFENFYFDLGEISSGSTTTHSDISLSEYDSFIFKEFVDELAHIISLLEYDCFYFRDLPDQGELMSVFNSEIRENLSTTSVTLPIEDDHSPLLAYVVWIFLAYLTYPVIPPYLHPFGNEDTIFDPGITIKSVYSFEPGSSHRHRAFKKFNTHR